MTDAEVVAPPADGDLGMSVPRRTKPVWRVIQILLAVGVVAISFLYAIPKIANYFEVWTEIRDMTPLELLFLVAATALNLVTYWWANMVSIPNLGLWQAAVNNQTSTTVANTMPGGGYVSIAVSYEMYRAWGFSKRDVGLSVAVTSVLNIFAKLALPAIALLLIIVTHRASGSLIGPSIVGVLILFGAVVLFGLLMWKKRFARAIGSGLGRAATWVARRFRRSRTFDWGEAAVRFRRNTIDFLVERWFRLTGTTIISHLSLYLVLLLALRFVGVSDAEVNWAHAGCVRVRSVAHRGTDHAWRARDRRGRVHRRADPRRPGPCGRPDRRLPRPGDGGRAGFPGAHLRDPDPTRSDHLRDLAHEHELAQAGADRGPGALTSPVRGPP